MARIWTGKFLAFRDYKFDLGQVKDPFCKKCKALDVHTKHDLKHWFTECPALAEKRMRVFGRQTELADLTRHPKMSLAFARQTLLRQPVS